MSCEQNYPLERGTCLQGVTLFQCKINDEPDTVALSIFPNSFAEKDKISLLMYSGLSGESLFPAKFVGPGFV